MSRKNIMLLAGNFCGNLGDIFIFEAVVNFIVENIPGAEIDVYPYPIRHDNFVSLPLAIKHRESVTFKEPICRLRGSADALMREHPFLEQVVSKYYFSPVLKKVKEEHPSVNMDNYDNIVVVGGEMDIPYSQLDVHSYIRQYPVQGINVTYGPVSIPNTPKYESFLKSRFSEVKHAAIRDPLSLERLRKMGIDNLSLIPDCAFLAFSEDSLRIEEATKNCIGVCLHSRWGYLKELESYIEALLNAAAQSDSKVHFFCTHPKEDAPLMKRLASILRNNEHALITAPSSTEELKNIYKNVDTVISDRLHGILIGLLSGCDILPLATRDKVKGYCEYLNLDQYLSGNESADNLSKMIKSLQSDRQLLREKHAEFMRAASKDVKAYYLESMSATHQ